MWDGEQIDKGHLLWQATLSSYDLGRDAAISWPEQGHLVYWEKLRPSYMYVESGMRDKENSMDPPGAHLDPCRMVELGWEPAVSFVQGIQMIQA